MVMILLAVGCFVAALTLFLAAQLMVELALPMIAATFFKFGSILLLAAFFLLIIYGILLIVAELIRSSGRFFSAPKRRQRRLLFVQADKDRVERLHHYQTISVQYHHDQRKKRLNRADDSKHFRALSQSIYKNVRALKKNLPASDYRRLKQEHARHHGNLDTAALIRLQQKLGERI